MSLKWLGSVIPAHAGNKVTIWGMSTSIFASSPRTRGTSVDSRLRRNDRVVTNEHGEQGPDYRLSTID